MNIYTREELASMGFEDWEIELQLEQNKYAEEYNKAYKEYAYIPTEEEIAKINAMLDAWENGEDLNF